MVAERPMDAEAAAVAYDVEVVSRWDARVTEAVLPKLAIPGGTALVAQCRTGYACEAILGASDEPLRLMAVDESRYMLDRARARLQDASGVYFNAQRPFQLSYATGVFGLAVCLAAPGDTWGFDSVLGELVRVAGTDKPIAIAGALSTGLDLLYEVLAESLHAAGLHGEAERASQHRASRLNEASAERALERCGATLVASGTLDVPLVLTGARSCLDTPLATALFGDLRDSLFQGLPAEVEVDVRNRMDTYLRGLAIEVRLESLWIVAQTGEERVEAVFEAEDLDLVEVDEDDTGDHPVPPDAPAAGNATDDAAP